MTEELSDKERAELEELKIEITTPVKTEEETATEEAAEGEGVSTEESNTGEEQPSGNNSEIWKTFAIDPETGYAVDPNTGAYIDPETGATIGGTFSDEEGVGDSGTDGITEITYDENGSPVTQ